jgi:hypothetical protein
MANYAVINGNIVTNTILAETKEDAELATGLTCIEYTTENPAGIGWTWDGTNFVAPAIEVIETEEPTE